MLPQRLQLHGAQPPHETAAPEEVEDGDEDAVSVDAPEVAVLRAPGDVERLCKDATADGASELRTEAAARRTRRRGEMADERQRPIRTQPDVLARVEPERTARLAGIHLQRPAGCIRHQERRHAATASRARAQRRCPFAHNSVCHDPHASALSPAYVPRLPVAGRVSCDPVVLLEHFD